MKREKTSKKIHLVAACRNSDGILSKSRDDNGKTYSYEQALGAIEQGMTENTLPFTERGGARHIRGINDGNEPTNLRSLKEF